jgi:hypothetical protein
MRIPVLTYSKLVVLAAVSVISGSVAAFSAPITEAPAAVEVAPVATETAPAGQGAFVPLKTLLQAETAGKLFLSVPAPVVNPLNRKGYTPRFVNGRYYTRF